jgi:pimeloyl-ACP methyl ester carboxylesterase
MTNTGTMTRTTASEALLRLPSGRRVAVHQLATSDGTARTIVFCHAAPGAGTFDPDPDETRSRNINLLSVDRPGYGGSEPLAAGEWLSVDRGADDIAEVLRERGIDRVSVAGWSAGGRTALALAARHPDLVDRVAVIATPAPDEAVPWIPAEQRDSLEALRGKPADDVHAALTKQMAGLVPSDPAAPEAMGLIGNSPADEQILAQGNVTARLVTMFGEAFAQGTTGMVAEIAGYCLRQWGFEPGDVGQKTLLVYGAKDAISGSRHGRWWQKQLPDARLEMVPDAGHLVVVPMWKRVLSFLAPTR